MIPFLTLIAKIILLGAIADFCALLGAWSGAEGTSKNWRRIGIPLILTFVAVILMTSQYGVLGLVSLLLMLLWPVLAIGYGIPTIEYGIITDHGSVLGRFWYRIFEGDCNKANLATRATVGVLYNLCLLPILYLTSSLVLYIIISILLLTNTVLWGAIIEGEGVFIYKGKVLGFEEFLRYYGLGFCYMFIILWGGK